MGIGAVTLAEAWPYLVAGATLVGAVGTVVGKVWSAGFSAAKLHEELKGKADRAELEKKVDRTQCEVHHDDLEDRLHRKANMQASVEQAASIGEIREAVASLTTAVAMLQKAVDELTRDVKHLLERPTPLMAQRR